MQTKIEQSAKRYAKQKYLLAAINIAVGLAFLVFMSASGGFASMYLKNLLSLLTTNECLLIALYLPAFIIIYEIIAMPLSFYGGFVLEHRFNLSNQTVVSWLKNEGKTLLISLIISIPIVEAIYFFLRNYPNIWWIFAGAVWLFLTVVMTKFMPILILPLFYKSIPIEDEELKDKLLRLATGAGLNVEGIYRINLSKDTKKANAALTGLGSTRRILLSDTLLNSFSHEEIEAVFAHELAHHVYRHVFKMLIVASICGFAGFALCHYVLSIAIQLSLRAEGEAIPIHDIAAFPLLVLVLSAFGFVLLPLQNAYSRWLEKDCDVYSIRKTGNPSAFISMMNKLAEQNLADKKPNRLIEILFYDHPPISKRIALAESTGRK
ncbi:MAG TPA: M48 family metallopeptidase [Candidatus Brocadiia bacterium]|nr:M48 family metallopeptidase [Candidatus Brocadiales bacterium]